MKKNKIIYINSIPNKYLLFKNKKKLNNKFNYHYKNILDNLNLPNNIFFSFSKRFNFSFKNQEINKLKSFKTIAVIGMGGSSLGSEAIYSFLKHKIKKNVLFLNNIDDIKIKEIQNQKKRKKILFIIISKSGSTIETLSNLKTLKIVKKNSKHILIISEKKNNKLFVLAKKNNLHFIEHKKFIGGRYSILTEVGIVPLILMGLNAKKFRENILNIFNTKNRNLIRENSLILSRLMNKKQFKTIVFLNYIPQLNKFLFWLQQLISESLGKKGKGFLPIISPAPKDHHSMLQLYLDGPKDKIFYIFSASKKSLYKITTKDLEQIKEAQKNAVIKSLKDKKIPFREFKIKSFTEETLSELFSYFMTEIVITAKLANVNPYDQPAVEQVKLDTKKLLS